MAWLEKAYRLSLDSMKKNKSLSAIGENIRARRQAAGFSQEQFANHIGMGRSFYGRVERGEQNISVLNLIKIARALHVELAQLLPSLKQFQTK